jgi:hypothetical protein
LLLYGRQSPEERLGPGSGQRYLVLTTTRISTMRGELRQAAAAGYRVLAGWSAPEIKREPNSYSDTSSQMVMLLEKVAADAGGQQSGDFPRKLEVTISVRNVRTGAVILEHSVQKHTTARALAYYSQSAAEACADHLKKIQEPKPK